MVKRTIVPPPAQLASKRPAIPPAVQRKASTLPSIQMRLGPVTGTGWPAARVIQRMELAAVVPTTQQVGYKLLADPFLLYHSTNMTKPKAKAIVEKNDSLRAPAYFKDVAYNSYGGRLIIFKITAPLSLVDFSVPGSTEAFYSDLIAASQFGAAEALVYKSKGKVDNGKWVVKPNPIFMTRSDLDKSLEAGLAALGEAGWFMPFNGFNEIMLLNLANVEASSWQ